MENVFRIKELGYVPRWLVFFIDVSIVSFSILVSHLFLENLDVATNFSEYQNQKIFLTIAVNILFMLVFKTYAGIIRYSTFFDFFKIIWSSGCTVIVMLAIDLTSKLIFGVFLDLYHELFLFFFISVFLMFFFRMMVKRVFKIFMVSKEASSKIRIVVVGIEGGSVSLGNAIIHNPTHPYQLKGFVNTESTSKKAILLGHKIYNKREFLKINNLSKQFDAVLLKGCMLNFEMEEWTNFALSKGLKVLRAPVINNTHEGGIIGDIRPIQIEDLLERTPITIERENVGNYHFDKSILVTGGAGSIGSEIVRQVALLNASIIVVVDQAESPLHELKLELLEKFPNQRFKFILADISNVYRLEKLFEEYDFSIVYHAAAYKHVPLIEDNPHEAIFVNVAGTRNLALLSKKYIVDRFVMVSTDKAVNPTNVMGASKRTAELFVQSLQNSYGNQTKFITTRFGNVLGSNGSIVPLFAKQIEQGGPLTITHPDIIRYFMTIPEACQLVLEAGTMGQGGEIFIFDMGEPVKIIDLARKMIGLAGFRPNEDIEIKVIGLRPGEKLYEELLNDDSKTLPTYNDQIMIALDSCLEYKKLSTEIDLLLEYSKKRSNENIVGQMKKIVPEFKSMNSVFQTLDVN